MAQSALLSRETSASSEDVRLDKSARFKTIPPFLPEDIEYCRHDPTDSMRAHLEWQAERLVRRPPE
jgi:hypothetical protein